MVERQLPKLNVAGSIPVSRSMKLTNEEIRPKTRIIYAVSSFFRLTAGNLLAVEDCR